jgi:hypothetical protein
MITISACNGQSSAYQKANETKKAIEDAPRPGTMPAKAGGWTMTAKVNGRSWSATSIMPPAAAGRMIGYVGNENYIGLPAFEKRSAKVGKRMALGEEQGGYSVDMWTSGDLTSYKNYKGSIQITNINGDWVEGTFSFTASSQAPAKTLVVSDGFFRVQL